LTEFSKIGKKQNFLSVKKQYRKFVTETEHTFLLFPTLPHFPSSLSKLTNLNFYLPFTCLFLNLSSLCIAVRGFTNINQQGGAWSSYNDIKKNMDFFVAYLDQRSQAGMCRPHRAASQTSAALPACCILNKIGLGHVVFVLRTFREGQVYVEPRVICTSQCHIYYQLPLAMHTQCQIMVIFLSDDEFHLHPSISESCENSI
jgi:hypothetical protein